MDKVDKHLYVMDDNHEVHRVTNREDWNKFRSAPKSTKIATDAIRQGARTITVSTFFLGIDFSAGKDPSPKLFCTTIFDNESKYSEQGKKYGTYAEAIAGHLAAVAKVKRDLGIPEEAHEEAESAEEWTDSDISALASLVRQYRYQLYQQYKARGEPKKVSECHTEALTEIARELGVKDVPKLTREIGRYLTKNAREVSAEIRKSRKANKSAKGKSNNRTKHNVPQAAAPKLSNRWVTSSVSPEDIPLTSTLDLKTLNELADEIEANFPKMKSGQSAMMTFKDEETARVAAAIIVNVIAPRRSLNLEASSIGKVVFYRLPLSFSDVINHTLKAVQQK